MRASEAKAIVAYLLAAFRPREWTDASTALFAAEIQGLEREDASEGAAWIVREGLTRMPSIAELRAACETARRLRLDRIPKLPEGGHMTEAEIKASRKAGAKILAAWRKGRPKSQVRSIEDVVATRPPVDVEVGFNPAEVEAKRAAARRAREQLEASS